MLLFVRNYHLQFWLSVGLLAVLSFASFFALQTVIKTNEGSATVINISGRQRMLSQRLALFCTTYFNEADNSKKITLASNIKALSDKMWAAHQGLIYGNDTLQLPETTAENVRNIFFQPPHQVDQQVKTYLHNIRQLLETTVKEEQKFILLKITEAASLDLLNGLDAVTKQYELNSRENIAKMESRSLVILLITLVILGLEVLFVFQPMFSNIKNHQADLEVQNQKLTDLNHDLEQFIYVVSHDLKTPVRGIHTLVQFIENDFAGTVNEQMQEYMNLIKRRVKRIYLLLEGIFTYGNLNRERDKQRNIDLNIFMKKIIEAARLPENASVEVNQVLPTLYFSEFWLKELFLNLIDNSLKFCDKPYCKIQINYQLKEDEHFFSVEDNGIGMEEKYFNRMFRLFQKLNTNENENNTAGLGLAIVKKIVTESGGNIWLESKPNVFFRVNFTFPLRKKTT